MQTKTFTLLFLLVCLISLWFSARSLDNLSRVSVYQATDEQALSGHADRESLSFTNWNNNDPPLIPPACAGCHGTTGFLDFLGEDGSTPGRVDREAPAGEVITCVACHNPSAHTLERVVFHSGAEFEPSRAEAVCLVCHQSRQSTSGIQAALQGLAEDGVSSDLSFINPHYNFAASTQLGSRARSGYEYPELEYAGYFYHAPGAQTCTDCHNPHSLKVAPQKCAVCHTNVVGESDFRAIRDRKKDFDGDGNTSEGIYHEIASLHERLLGTIQAYARSLGGKPIVYGETFPYFFVDINDNGIADADEMNRGNRYDAWTPRLLKAAYNYQFVKKDPGGYVHNPLYVIQLLHDSLKDLQTQVSLPEVRLKRP